MKIFTTILLTIFIGACTGNTTVSEKPASSNDNAVKATPLSPQPSGAKEATAEALEQSTERDYDKQKQQAVPTIVVTPREESDGQTSGNKVPEKE
tara:strand:+ start:86 stop:370 length:285 start_codon:yes stop_codon:yes gene_type:complete